MRWLIPAVLGAVAAFLVSPPSLRAQSPSGGRAEAERLGEGPVWSAWRYGSGTSRVCYLIAQPAKSEPATARRGAVKAFVTHRVGDKERDVVSFDAGYPFAERAEVELEIDGRKFLLFTKDETAWARDAVTDRAIVETMGKGKQAVLRGTSARGTATVDVYPLTGFAAALRLIDQGCGVKR